MTETRVHATAEPYVQIARDTLVEAALVDGVNRATDFYRARRWGRGEYELVRTGLKVARIEGDTASIDALSDLIYVEFGNPPAQGASS